MDQKIIMMKLEWLEAKYEHLWTFVEQMEARLVTFADHLAGINAKMENNNVYSHNTKRIRTKAKVSKTTKRKVGKGSGQRAQGVTHANTQMGKRGKQSKGK